MDISKIKVFYDGTSIAKYSSNPLVCGFTMNSTFIKQSGFPSYKEFNDANSNYINSRPISYQVTSDSTILSDARELSSLGSNVYVKVPVINTKGEYNLSEIKTLLSENIKVNVTCIFTIDQVNECFKELSEVTTPFVLSIFAGGVSDTGADPSGLVKHCVDTFINNKNVEVLWAGVKDNLAVMNAVRLGCHIITIPDTVMDRIGRIGLDIYQMSIDKVKLFNTDATGIRTL